MIIRQVFDSVLRHDTHPTPLAHVNHTIRDDRCKIVINIGSPSVGMPRLGISPLITASIFTLIDRKTWLDHGGKTVLAAPRTQSTADATIYSPASRSGGRCLCSTERKPASSRVM